jgi:hypothetical protein
MNRREKIAALSGAIWRVADAFMVLVIWFLMSAIILMWWTILSR